MGGVRGLGARAVAAVLFAALVLGVVGAAFVTPAAGDRASGSSPPPRAMPPSALVANAAVADDRGVGLQNSGAVAVAPVSATLNVPGPSSPAVAPVPRMNSAPANEPQVAVDLFASIDALSQGAYGIASTPGNVVLLEKWMANEGGLWADNPLNTSLYAARYPHQFTSSGQDTGIPIYPDIQTGIDATAATLVSNVSYAAILAVLNDGTGSCLAFARAVIASPWASSHYGGDPAHFCGATGGALPFPVVTTACRRLPGGSAHRSHRGQGECGRRTPGRGHGVPRLSHHLTSEQPRRTGAGHRMKAATTTPDRAWRPPGSILHRRR